MSLMFLGLGVFILTLGLGAFLVVIYPSSMWYLTSTVPYTDPQGFLFFTSEGIKNSSFLILIDNLKGQQGFANVHIHADISLIKRANNGSAYFVLQVLSKVANVEVQINEKSLNILEPSVTVIPYPSEGVSYILIEVPREETSESLLLKMNFKWEDVFRRISQHEFSMTVSFNVAFPSFINDVPLPEETVSGGNLFIPDYTSSAILSIARPEAEVISEVIPVPDNQGYSYDKVWFSWDIRKRTEDKKFASTAITIKVSSERQRTVYEYSLAVVPFLLGLSIPLTITSLFEYMKLARLTEKGSKRKM